MNIEHKFKKKVMMWGISAALSLLMFALPIFAIGTVVAVPVQAVSDFFDGIGTFLFGDGETDADQLVVIIQSAISNSETQTQIKQVYTSKLDNAEAPIPLHQLVVIQLITGIEFEDMSDDLLDMMIEASITRVSKTEVDDEGNESVIEEIGLNELSLYVDNLKKHDPFKSKLSDVDTSAIVQIIERVGSVDVNSSIPQEIIDKYKGKLLYPFRQKYGVGDSIGIYYPSGVPEMHNGLDIQAPCGVNAYAMDDGIVTQVGNWDNLRGNYIFWENGDMQYRYLHFQQPVPHRVGDSIKKGQFMGIVGNEGYSFGCHLHLETRHNGEVIDPLEILDAHNPFFE